MWKRWKKIAEKAAEMQINVLFSILYILILIPISFFAKKNLSRTMQIKIDKNKKSYWTKKEKFVQNLKWAHRQ